MQRRSFLSASAAAVAVPCGLAAAAPVGVPSNESVVRHSVAVDGNQVRFFTEAVSKPIRISVIADTHLFRDDERGRSFQEYSGRMAAAYNQTKHFQTGEDTDPEACFVRSLERAQQQNVDLVALVGDIFSFPSEAAIEWVAAHLEASKLRYTYVAGNHDWHYEGMPGSLVDLRATWIEKRLKPLYQGNHPLMSAYDVREIRLLMIDNSNYQILPEQLEFFRLQVKTGRPLVLMLHIPLFAPGRSIGFGCGNPEWGASTDRNYRLERRPQWPAAGHTRVTMDFHQEVFSTPNLLGVFAGHVHRQSCDLINGIPQFVTDDNASGGFLDVEFLRS